MLTTKEKLAREVAIKDLGIEYDQLDVIYQHACDEIAANELYFGGIQLARQDKIAAQTWGGDIDLVSF
jgi:hypothetical protein